MTKEDKPRKYDLEERTALFAENVIQFAKKIGKKNLSIRHWDLGIL